MGFGRSPGSPCWLGRVLALPEQQPADHGRGGREQRADEEGGVVAVGERDELVSPAASELSVREAATLARTASPSAPPIMNEVLTMPDASPASLGSTSLIAASSTGLNAMPAPKPSRIMLGQHVDDEVAVDRRAREEQQPERGQRQPGGERRPEAEPHDELRREPERERRP